MADFGINIGVSQAAGRADLRLDPYLACHFLLEIEGLLVGGFAEISGLEVETEVFTYRQGGENDHPRHFTGPTKYAALVLKHGLSPVDGLWSWHQDVVNGVITRRNGTIYLVNAERRPVMWWELREALPVKWRGPVLDASKSTVAFETIDLVHHGLLRPAGDSSVPDVAGESLARLGDAGGFF